MTHGDKAKAKAGKKGQASAKTRDAKSGENGKGAGKKAVGKSAKAESASGKKGSAEKAGSAEKTSSGKTAAPKERAPEADPRAKGRVDAGGIGDPLLAAAFKRAVKTYPNAFRKLTD